MVSWFDKQEKIIRIILLIPIWGWIVALLYRIFKYVDGTTKNTLTLVVGILCVIPLIGFVVSLIDLVTTITKDKITFLAD